MLDVVAMTTDFDATVLSSCSVLCVVCVVGGAAERGRCMRVCVWGERVGYAVLSAKS